MHFPTLEEELQAIIEDAGTNVVVWCAHVKEHVQKALDKLKVAEQRVLDERANAVRVCEELAAEYLAKGEEVGWKFNATGALAAADRIRIGRRVVAAVCAHPAESVVHFDGGEQNASWCRACGSFRPEGYEWEAPKGAI